jgi:DNA-binding transcriptional LysR family regulator
VSRIAEAQIYPRSITIAAGLGAEPAGPLSLRAMPIDGIGLTVLPTFLVADALRAGKLLSVLQDRPVVSDGIFVVYPPSRHLSTKVRALIEHLTAAFKGAIRGKSEEQCGGALCRRLKPP